VSISFKGQRFPNYIYLYMVRYELSPFIPKTTQCFSCFHFDHSKFQCKGYSRCIHCGERSHDQVICPKKDLPPVCVNCKGPHKSNDSSCPEFNIQKRIRELAAFKNIPLSDAKFIIKESGKNNSNNLKFNSQLS